MSSGMPRHRPQTEEHRMIAGNERIPWPNHAAKTWVRVLRVCGGALAAAVLLYDEATAQNRSHSAGESRPATAGTPPTFTRDWFARGPVVLQQGSACSSPLKIAAGACVRDCPGGYEDRGSICISPRGN